MAQVAVRQIEVDNPRPFGYLIGDRIERDIRFELSKPYRLEVRALPKPGRINLWLELRPPRVEASDAGVVNRYRIKMTYQARNLDARHKTIAVPQLYRFTVPAMAARSNKPSPSPAWRFTVATLTDPAESVADIRPPLAPPVKAMSRLAVAIPALLLVVALTGLAYAWGLGAGWGRSPFAVAIRRLRRLRRDPWDAAHYGEALRYVHAAFNETAGQTLFAEGLDAFFARAPRYAPLQHAITALFRHSRAVFFGAYEEGAHYSLAALIAICRDCRRAERGLA
ncbi:MAG: hypothetical protein U1F68_07675 [Gammaproteobacteria bacterium]